MMKPETTRPPARVPAPAELPSRGPWSLADIDYVAIDRPLVAGDATLFQIVALASFIETGSDLYAHNLVAYFDDDAEVAQWLAQSWEHEEVQHGAALRAYVERAWPDFDWRRAFDAFFDEYSQTCTVPDLEPARALELAARCVVETGTATLYSALHAYAREPVLKDLAGRIYADEVRHYKHFYRYFRRYQARERHGRWRVGRTLGKRLFATRNDDGLCAYRNLWRATHPGEHSGADHAYRAFVNRMGTLAHTYAPRELPIDMLLRPLQLPPVLSRGARSVAGAMYHWWLR
jgi:hypothetical protein